MRITDISPAFKNWQTELEHIADTTQSPWKAVAENCLAVFYADFDDLDEMFNNDILYTLHEAQRAIAVSKAGLLEDKAFDDAYCVADLYDWIHFETPPVSDELQHSLAEKIYNITPGNDDYAILAVGDGSPIIAEYLIRKLVADKVPFELEIFDGKFNNLIINHATEDGIKNLAQYVVDKHKPANKRMLVRTEEEQGKPLKADPEKNKVFAAAKKEIGDRLTSGDLFYTLTLIPTPADAKREGMRYEEFIKLYFEMCDQPWAHIKAAQAKLIDELDVAKTIRITNNDGTDVTMDIEGFTFCNSLIAKNVPGSEVFSCPAREGVNGTIVAKGRFSHHSPGEIIENLTMHFENGRIVAFSADKGAEFFQKFLDADPGNYYAGELGLGTNPHLDRHVLSSLLVEKVGGSFHVALGSPYSYTVYDGKPVNLNNGNKSDDHWDITTLLRGKQGCIWLDDRKVMDDGKWLDPAYDVLNRGWATVPVEERPDQWKDFKGYDKPVTLRGIFGDVAKGKIDIPQAFAKVLAHVRDAGKNYFPKKGV